MAKARSMDSGNTPENPAPTAIAVAIFRKSRRVCIVLLRYGGGRESRSTHVKFILCLAIRMRTPFSMSFRSFEAACASPLASNLAWNQVPVSYTHLRAHETGRNLVCRLLLEKKK